jgi:hypothetical protein
MPIRKRPGGNYLPWYFDLQAKGRARKRTARPKRDILMVKSALQQARLRYCQEVSFWNPDHQGKPGSIFGALDGGLQWVDFIVRGKRPFAIVLDDPRKRYHEHERVTAALKIAGLIERGVPVLVLPAGRTSQEYWVRIHTFRVRNKV